ncbi:MAG: hydroxymethylbilane synthase [Burkholderiaceae bacterium]|nr:hydroxymethylbilane synthase [Burkholderiaceae bacterium]
MWQAEHVQARLRAAYPVCEVEILGMTTEGDRVLDRALNEIGGKGLFIKELEVALLDRRADLAVHSLKDVPMELGEPFVLAAILAREDPRDAFVSNRHASLETLPPGARVGTSSLRRAAQIRRAFPSLELLPLRGNVNTRLARLDDGRYDAIILAAAGLKRLGFAARIRAIVPPSLSLPAAGQGALAIETLSARTELQHWLAPLADARTAVEVHAERTVSRLLGGSCRVPLAAWCVSTPQGGLKLVARVAAEDGSEMAEAIVESPQADYGAATGIGEQAAQSLRDQGADRWLASS